MTDFVDASSGTRQKAPRTATAALVFGLLTFILWILAGIPAIIFGHKALNAIRRSGDLMGGKGRAITGLVLGYLSFAAIPVLAGLAVPVVSKVQENGRMSHVLSSGRQIYLALETYNRENVTYPETLGQLVDAGVIEDTMLSTTAVCPALTYDGGAPEGQMFHYFQPAPDDPGDTVVLISDCSFSGRQREESVRRIVIRRDGSGTSSHFPPGPVAN